MGWQVVAPPAFLLVFVEAAPVLLPRRAADASLWPWTLGLPGLSWAAFGPALPVADLEPKLVISLWRIGGLSGPNRLWEEVGGKKLEHVLLFVIFRIGIGAWVSLLPDCQVLPSGSFLPDSPAPCSSLPCGSSSLLSSHFLCSGPHFVAVNNKNEIVVTDFHNHSVKVREGLGPFQAILRSGRGTMLLL